MQKVRYNCGCEFNLDENGKIILATKIENMPLDCKITWDLLCSGDTLGVFQLESHLGKSLSKKVLPRSIEELADLISIMRPGVLEAIEDGKNLTNHYIDRKHGREDVTYYHKALEPIVNKTYGILIYQEQAMEIAKELAGFTMQEADNLRKACIAKGSLVMTQDGPRYIEDIVDKHGSTKILTTKNNKIVFSKINQVWSNGVKDVSRIRTANGYSICLTKDHEVFTQDGWKNVASLTLDDFVIIPNQYHYKGYTKHINENLSVILSYFIGEGCWTEKCDPKITNSDKWILDSVKNKLIEEFGEGSFRESNCGNGCTDIHFKGLAREWIEKIYTKCRARHKYIPNSICTSQNGITEAFIGSYFSGEGDVSIKNRIVTISSTSYDICIKLQMMLLRDGIHSSVTQKNSTYKNEPYISFKTLISDPSDICKFINTYKQYICPAKLEQLEKITDGEFRNSRFLVPSVFIKAAVSNKNINCILGHAEATGTIYNSNITYDKAYRINNKINSDLLNDIISADFKFVKIVSIDEMPPTEVFDFTVDDDVHSGFINGILVHNCGKKLPEEMAKVKTMFLSKAKEKGILNEEEINEVFGWIEKSQRYSFNKSHAVSYAIDGYLSAYCKAHFPREFFTSYLAFSKNEANFADTVSQLVANAKRNSVDVFPPDIRKRNHNYKLYDDGIYCGISNIKGVGTSILASLDELIRSKEVQAKKPLDRWNWTEFLMLCGSSIKKNAFQALVSAGALSFLKVSRRRILYEYEKFCELTERDISFLQSLGGESFLEKLKVLANSAIGRGKPLSNKNSKEKISNLVKQLENPPYSLEDSAAWISEIESQTIGISLTCSKVDDCDQSAANCTCKDFLDGKAGFIMMAVNLDEVREHIIKNGVKKGEKMAFIKASDSSCSLDGIVCFTEAWLECKDTIIQGNTVMLGGSRDKKNKDTFVVTKAWQI